MRHLAKLLCAALLLLAPAALAGDMAACQTGNTASLQYVTKPRSICALLCHNVGTGSGASCGASTFSNQMLGDHLWGNCFVAFTKVPASCDTGTFTIGWSATSSCAAPAVVQNVASLTGAALISSVGIPYMPGKVWCASFSAIGDSDCTVGGSDGIDVALICDQLDN